MVITLFFLLSGVVYLGMLLYFLIGIYRISTATHKQLLSVTVLIPARNEEKNISPCMRVYGIKPTPESGIEW